MDRRQMLLGCLAAVLPRVPVARVAPPPPVPEPVRVSYAALDVGWDVLGAHAAAVGDRMHAARTRAVLEALR